MGFLDGIYFSTVFWGIFLLTGTISMVLMKLNKLKVIQITAGFIFWLIFLVLFAGMIHHESNISHFLKEVETNLVEANVKSKEALSEGKETKYGVQVSLNNGTKYLISDVNIDDRKIKLFEKNSDDSDKFENVKLKEIVYGGYKLSQVRLTDEEKEVALKKSKTKKAKQPMK